MDKPGQSDKKDERMVAESTLVSVKKEWKSKYDKANDELAKTKSELSKAQSDLKIAKTDVDDDEEVKKVRAMLVEEADELRKKREVLEKDLSSFQEREREVTAKELASKYGIDADALKDSEDMEKEALRLKLEKLSGEGKEPPPESSVYEREHPSIAKKGAWDLSDEEFNKQWDAKNREALSRK